MLIDLDPDELSTWQAFYSIYPFPEERADMRAGLNRHTIYEMHAKEVPSVEKCTLCFEPTPPAEAMKPAKIKSMFHNVFKHLPIIRKPRPKNGSNKKSSR